MHLRFVEYGINVGHAEYAALQSEAVEMHLREARGVVNAMPVARCGLSTSTLLYFVK